MGWEEAYKEWSERNKNASWFNNNPAVKKAREWTQSAENEVARQQATQRQKQQQPTLQTQPQIQTPPQPAPAATQTTQQVSQPSSTTTQQSTGEKGMDDFLSFVNTYNQIKSAMGGGAGNEDNRTATQGNVQSGTELIGQFRPQTMQDVRDLAGLTNDQLMKADALNAQAQQRSFNNLSGLQNQQQRADAANNVLNAYQNARSANQQFLSNLSGAYGKGVSAY